MPQCSVPGCSLQGGHRFPKDSLLRKTSVVALKREAPNKKGSLWEPGMSACVCHTHFREDDYQSTSVTGHLHRKRVLLSGSVPSVNLPNFQLMTASVSERRKRATKRKAAEDLADQETNSAMEFVGEVIEISTRSTTECTVDINEEPQSVEIQIETTYLNTKTASTQTTEPNQIWSVGRFDDKGIHHYTGLGSQSKFAMVLASLGDDRFNLQYYYNYRPTIPIDDQFLLTLIKLRIHPSNEDLVINFGIHRKMVTNIFVTWINFIYHQWKDVEWWAEQDLVRFYSPDHFKVVYPRTRSIIDGTEFPAQKPHKPTAQQATWSSYKNKNTVKVLAGVTPGGLVNFISESYGGAASDRQIVERSGITQMVNPGDELMADKGFNCEDIFLPYLTSLNIPSFFKSKNRMSGANVTKDRKIASKRVHVERIIGLAKTYKILREPMNPVEINLSTPIISVCFWLCNFRSCIMSQKSS